MMCEKCAHVKCFQIQGNEACTPVTQVKSKQMSIKWEIFSVLKQASHQAAQYNVAMVGVTVCPHKSAHAHWVLWSHLA